MLRILSLDLLGCILAWLGLPVEKILNIPTEDNKLVNGMNDKEFEKVWRNIELIRRDKESIKLLDELIKYHTS